MVIAYWRRIFVVSLPHLPPSPCLVVVDRLLTVLLYCVPVSLEFIMLFFGTLWLNQLAYFPWSLLFLIFLPCLLSCLFLLISPLANGLFLSKQLKVVRLIFGQFTCAWHGCCLNKDVLYYIEYFSSNREWRIIDFGVLFFFIVFDLLWCCLTIV